MSQIQRYMIFIALSVGILFSWQLLFPPPPPEQSADTATVATSAAPTPGATPTAPAAPAPAPSGLVTDPPDGTPEQRIDVRTSLWDASWSTQGGSLRRFGLLGDKQRHRPQDGQERAATDLVHPGEGQSYPLTTLVDGVAGFDASAPYRVVQQGPHSLTLTRSAGGYTLTKRVTWDDGSYKLNLSVELQRPEGAPATPVRIVYPAYETPTESGGMFASMAGRPDVHQAVCLPQADRSITTRVHTDETTPTTLAGPVDFAGTDEKYFLAALSPLGPTVEGTACVLSAPRPGAYEAALVTGAQMPAGGWTFDLFLGPKDKSLLEATGHRLIKSIDFGFFAVICEVLLSILKALQSVVGNWGVAIILLTVLVKALTFPLTHKQMAAMEKMRALAPRLEGLKSQYADDPQTLQLKTMEMYREHNANPLGGCLPMLVQLPVWFALYSMLGTSFELYNEPFVAGWINDLTSKDPYYIAPVIMVGSMVLSQRLMPTTTDNAQMRFMNWFMPLFFGFIMVGLPSGLVVYMLTNNLLSVAQSLWFRRRTAAAAAG